jgi:hypothetical protein
MSDLCARWIALADREALGEMLTTDEAVFAREHAMSCAECRAEAELFNEMRSLVDGAVSPERAFSHESPFGHDGARADRPSGLRDRDAHDDEVPAGVPRRRGGSLVIAAALVCAAAVASVIARGTLESKTRTSRLESNTVSVNAPNAGSAGGQGSVVPASTTAPTPADVRVVLAVTSGGSVEIDGRTFSVGQELVKGSVLFAREGSACVHFNRRVVTDTPSADPRVESFVRACVSKGSLLRVADTRAAMRLELLGGKIAADLDPLPAGTSFGITTREGSAIAVGTAFSVDVPPGDAPVVTRVLHGTVVVRASGGTEHRVGAHEMSSMSGAVGSPPTALPAADEERDRALMMTTPAARGALDDERAFSNKGALSQKGEILAPVRIDSDSPGAIVTVDDRIVGVSPVAVLLTTGDHVVEVAAPSRAAVRETLRVDASGPIARRFELPAASQAVRVAESPRSSAELLTLARERRAHGDLDGSIAAYRELFERYATSVEAHTALVPYGELQMTRLSDARGALASFDRYLARGGSLEEEASFGRIRALRALGRTSEERVAVEAFVRRFPDGPLASSLRERLGDSQTRGEPVPRESRGLRPIEDR